MKRLRDYRPFLRDGKVIARTFGQRLLGPMLVDEIPLRAGDVQRIVDRIHPNHVDAVVTHIQKLTPTTKRLSLAPKRGVFPPFVAGQYVNVFVNIDGVNTSRPYSIVSTPGRQGSIDLVIKRKETGFVSGFLLDQLKAGSALRVSAPSGDFHYNPLRDTSAWVMIAGGSGIAPFMSMIEDAFERALPVQMLLLYGSRSPSDIIFRRRLDKLARAHRNFDVVHVVSEPDDTWDGETELLDETCILRHVPRAEMADKTFYVCGPGVMYELVVAALDNLRVPRRRVHVEAYGAPDDISRATGWPAGTPVTTEVTIEVEGRDEPVRGRTGEPLMNALERAGLVVPALCRSGTCATCRTRLISGEVFAPPGVALRETDRAANIIHPCMTYPLGDVRIRLA